MAFGDVSEVIATNADSETISATIVGTVSADDLLIVLHHVDHATQVSVVDTSGFTEDLRSNNSTEGADVAVYHKVAASGSDNTVTCSAGGAQQLQKLILLHIEGPFDSSPTDLAATSGRTTSNPASSGTSGSSTAQASEFMVGVWNNDSFSEAAGTFSRLGTATPTSAMTAQQGTNVSGMSLDCATQTLTAVGTVGCTVPNGFSDAMTVGYVTYKEDVGGGPATAVQDPIMSGIIPFER